MGESESTVGNQVSDSQPPYKAGFLDAFFEALADQRRRYALYVLRDYETPVALANLADEIATREQGTPFSDIPAEEVKRVYMSLYHTHIPKLVEADIIEYSQEKDLVTLSAEDHVEVFLDRANL